MFRNFGLLVVALLIVPSCISFPSPCNSVIYSSRQPPSDARYVVLVRNLAPVRTYVVDPSNNRDYYLAPKNGFCFFYFDCEPPPYIAFRNPCNGKIYWKCNLRGQMNKKRVFNGIHYNEEVVSVQVPGC